MSNKMAAFLLLFVFLSGCMSHKTLQTEQWSGFKKQMRSEHKEIKDMELQMSPTQIEINYYLDRKPDVEEDQELFMKAKALALSSDFQRTVIEESYFKHYSKDERRYPDIIIRFFGTKKDVIQFEYFASYYGPGFEGAKDRPIDAYKTWFFNDFKTKSVPVEP